MLSSDSTGRPPEMRVRVSLNPTPSSPEGWAQDSGRGPATGRAGGGAPPRARDGAPGRQDAEPLPAPGGKRRDPPPPKGLAGLAVQGCRVLLPASERSGYSDFSS